MGVGNIKTPLVVSVCVKYIDMKSYQVRGACCRPVSPTAEGKTPTEFFLRIEIVYSKGIACQTNGFKWCHEFNECGINVQDNQISGTQSGF